MFFRVGFTECLIILLLVLIIAISVAFAVRMKER
jgi:hypothetical protein